MRNKTSLLQYLASGYEGPQDRATLTNGGIKIAKQKEHLGARHLCGGKMGAARKGADDSCYSLLWPHKPFSKMECLWRKLDFGLEEELFCLAESPC